MAKFKIKDDQGNVLNTILADLAFVQANFLHYEEVAEAPVPPPKRTQYSNLEFLLLFTANERKAIKQAAKNNPDVEDFLFLLEMSQGVDTTHPMTVAGVNALETGGLLASGRAAEILA